MSCIGVMKQLNFTWWKEMMWKTNSSHLPCSVSDGVLRCILSLCTKESLAKSILDYTTHTHTLTQRMNWIILWNIKFICIFNIIKIDIAIKSFVPLHKIFITISEQTQKRNNDKLSLCAFLLKRYKPPNYIITAFAAKSQLLWMSSRIIIFLLFASTLQKRTYWHVLDFRTKNLSLKICLKCCSSETRMINVSGKKCRNDKGMRCMCGVRKGCDENRIFVLK